MTAKPKTKRVIIDGHRRKVPVDSLDQTETPDATIRRLARELEELKSELRKTADWFFNERKRAERLSAELTRVRGMAFAISTITSEICERRQLCEIGHDADDDIPF